MKNLNVGGLDAKVYLDVDNVFNIKNFNPGSFEGSQDFDRYIESLRIKEEYVAELPEWPHETGDDKPGELDEDDIYDPETGEGYIDPPNLKSLRHLWPRRFRVGLRFSF